MKKATIIILTALVIVYNSSFAKSYIHKSNIEIKTEDFHSSKIKFNSLLDESKAIIYSSSSEYDARINTLLYTIHINDDEFEKFNKMLKTIGKVSKQNSITVDNENEIKQKELQLKFTLAKKASYETEYELMANRGMEEKRQHFWGKLQDIDLEIYNIKKYLVNLKNEVDFNILEIKIIEQIYTPQVSQKGLLFVNMPGVTYNYLMIENPNSELSASSYSGWEIKYMITKGKTHINIGGLKTNETSTNKNFIKELFVVSLGQDFYPRYFGEGNYNYLNLYSGYNLGFFVPTYIFERGGNIKMYATVNLGLELFKNKYVLFDTNVSYFLPFSNIRNLRGLSFRASFNFVF